jgi:DNA-binding LytR/AlgR family response regulator
LLVAVVNYLLFPVLFNIALTWDSFFRAVGITLSVGLLPIIIYTLYKQNRWLQLFRKEAGELQRHLDEKKNQEAEKKSPYGNEEEITITGEGQREKLSVRESELVYIEASSNYMKVYFEQKGKLAYAVIRTTMKKVEELFAKSPVLFRCHRAYIVHLEKIEKVEGNAQGYKLKLAGTEERIPVSRNLNREFADRLLAVKNTMILFAAE